VVSGRLDRRRLALVAARFQSPFDGERLAALDAFGRLLRAGGTSWQDFVSGASPPQPDQGAESDDAPAAPSHVEAARTFARRGAGVLTAWEKQFLHGLQAYSTLSPKQARMLAEIERKVSVFADAEAGPA